jgi:SpoVK/Ycf46/Vps4 family AAA+-type ATPase
MTNKSIVWDCANGTDYIPSKPISTKLPDGIYKTKFTPELGIHLTKMDFKNDVAFPILEDIYDLLKDDVDKFIENKERYKKSKIQRNRASLLYGYPGSGKKHLAKRIAQSFKGIVLYSEEISDIKQIMPYIKNNRPSADVLVIIEEVAVCLEVSGIPAVVDLFKSKDKEDGVYIIATTDYENRVKEYLTDKPGIFGQKFKVGIPSEEDRLNYINFLNNALNLKITPNQINKITKETDGLVLENIKNLIESVFIYDFEYKSKLEDLKEMQEHLLEMMYPPMKNNDFDDYED